VSLCLLLACYTCSAVQPLPYQVPWTAKINGESMLQSGVQSCSVAADTGTQPKNRACSAVLVGHTCCVDSQCCSTPAGVSI
jgi:hypothetical protein